MRLACERFAARVPLLANMVEGGKTPLLPGDELQALGFRIAIFPGGLARFGAMARSIEEQEGARLPGARRLLLRKKAEREGMQIPPALLAEIERRAVVDEHGELVVPAEGELRLRR